MKKCVYLIIVIVAMTASSVVAQTSDAETDAMVNLLGVQKREAMSQLVVVSKKDSVAFWKLYDEYQNANRKPAKERLMLYERTAMSYQNMTPAVADSLSSKYFSNRLAQEKLLQDYYKKIKNATNAVTAFTFYQGESYLILQLRAQIFSQIPTYGELVRMMQKN